MNAYVIQSNQRIEPFMVEPGEVMVNNKKLSEIQAIAFRNNVFTFLKILDISKINDSNEYIVAEDSVYFEPELLGEFIKRSKRAGVPTVCAVKAGVFTKRTFVNTQDVKKSDGHIEYKLWYFPKNARPQPARPIIFDLDTNLENLLMPKHILKEREYLIPSTPYPIIQINHWANIWAANLISIFSNVYRLEHESKIKLFILALKNLSLNRWKVASRMNKIGKNCDIHHTAYIEASVLGDNVVVAAGAVIRESVVGSGTVIGNGVVVETSTIGDECTILNGHILYSVVYSGLLSVTHMISASVIGKNCFVGSGAVLTDFRFDGKSMQVLKNEKIIDTENVFLGVCLGDNVYLGANCTVAPGRSVSSNSHISLDKDRVINNRPFTGFRTT